MQHRTVHPNLGLLFLTAILLLLALCIPARAQTAPAGGFTDGQKIEVREGDVWSAAVVVKKEGRRYLVRYEGADATEEWVTFDRVRTTGAASGAANPPATQGAGQASAPKPQPIAWDIGQKVDVKWGGLWFEASITNKRGEWYLITYTRDKRREWVEPWRIRKAGSQEDKVGHASPHTMMRDTDGPPTEKPGPAPKPFGAQDTEPAASSYESDPAYKAADWTDSKGLPLVAPAGDWKLPLDPAPEALVNFAPQPVRLNLSADGPFASAKTVVISRSTPLQAFVVQGGDREELKVEKVNPAGGGSAGPFTLPQKTNLLDAAPDGKTVVLCSEDFGAGKKDRLEIWVLDGAAPRRTLIFYPYGQNDWTGRNVEDALFVDATHLLTVNNRGTLALWDLATCKAIYNCTVPTGTRLALSAGGKYLPVPADGATVILEPLTGKALAHLPRESSSSLEYSFSPSGKQLAGWSGRNIEVWDLTTGQLDRQFTVPVSGSSFAITTDGYGLLDGQYIIDFERRITLWKYDSPRAASAVAPGGRSWFAMPANGRNMVLTSFSLPHPQATALARTLKADELLLLKPGTKVSLAVNINADDQQRQEVTESLRKRLTDNKLIVEDNQPIRLIASTEAGKTYEQEYRRFGAPFGQTEKATITEQKSRLAVEVDGKTAWETVSISRPSPSLSLKQGQSVQDAVNEASKPNMTFFNQAQLPTYLPKPHDPAWYGSCRLTPQGPAPSTP